MGIFSSMFPGITGFNPAFEQPMMSMFMRAPPNVGTWLRTQSGPMMSAKGPFETVMRDMFTKAPPDIQNWARGYATNNHLGFLTNILGGGAPAAPATRGFVNAAPAARPAPAAGPYGQIINTAAQRYGLDPNLLTRLVGAESAGINGRVSPKGAAGLAQLMPATAAAMGVKDVNDPVQNINGGAHYLRLMMDRYGGDPAKALAAYNWGPLNVDRWLAAGASPAHMPSETRAYVATILGNKPMQAAADIPVRSISSNPDAALVHAAGMSSPSDPAPQPGLSSPSVPAAPVAPAGPMVAAAGRPGGGIGGFGGGAGGGQPPMTAAALEAPTSALEAALAAGQANQAARAAMEGLVPVPEQLSTSGKPLQDVMGTPDFTQQGGQGGLMQRIFGGQKLATLGGGIKYRA